MDSRGSKPFSFPFPLPFLRFHPSRLDDRSKAAGLRSNVQTIAQSRAQKTVSALLLHPTPVMISDGLIGTKGAIQRTHYGTRVQAHQSRHGCKKNKPTGESE
jgi:hypothetical protein